MHEKGTVICVFESMRGHLILRQKDLAAFFANRSKSFIQFIENSTNIPDLYRILLVGGGQHDYAQFVLEAREFQHIPVKEIGLDEEGTTQHPERLAAYGMFVFGRRFYDVSYTSFLK